MQKRLDFLLERYLNRTATEAERAELFEFISREENRPYLNTLLTDKWMQQSPDEVMPFSLKSEDNVLAEILNRQYAETPVRRMFPAKKWIAAAASLIIIAGTAIYFSQTTNDNNKLTAAAAEKPPVSDDIVAGTNKATLTLADGTSVILGDDTDKALTDAHNNIIQKKGELIYVPAPDKNKNTAAITYNTMTTPIGGQYKIKLPDGTYVWLNAASSIRYPVAFDDKERAVTVTGEAYFEVARDAKRKFLVNLNGSVTEVLGTDFNVKGYPDEEEVMITLAEGSVKVSGANANGKILKPGQQAGWDNKTGKIIVAKADVETALAWKNGLFQFNGENIEKIMHMLGKWYGVEVAYADKIPAGHYSGVVSRSSNLSKVLKILEESGLHFSLEGKKLTVL